VSSRKKGKHRTRLNAYKHGRTCQIHLQTAAENEAFRLHCAGIREALAPVCALELDLAQPSPKPAGASIGGPFPPAMVPDTGGK